MNPAPAFRRLPPHEAGSVIRGLRPPEPVDRPDMTDVAEAVLTFLPEARLLRLTALDTVPPIERNVIVGPGGTYWLDGGPAPLRRAIADSGLRLTTETAPAFLDFHYRYSQTLEQPAGLVCDPPHGADPIVTELPGGYRIEACLQLGPRLYRSSHFVGHDGAVSVEDESPLDSRADAAVLE